MGLALPDAKPSILNEVTFHRLSPELVQEAAEALTLFRANLKEAIEASGNGRTFPKHRTPYAPTDVARQISEGTLKGFLAFHNGHAIGLIAYSPIVDTVAGTERILVSALWAHRDTRRQGLARGLLAHACFSEQKPALIAYDKDNNAAKAFYEWLRRASVGQGPNRGVKNLDNAKFITYVP